MHDLFNTSIQFSGRSSNYCMFFSHFKANICDKLLTVPELVNYFLVLFWQHLYHLGISLADFCHLTRDIQPPLNLS